MPFIRLALVMLFSAQVWALPEFKTKQALNKIRFISQDGKVTYYQKNTGEFQLSTNYNFANILKKEKYTQYKVDISASKSRIAIEAIPHFFSDANVLKNNEIYTALYASKKNIQMIGKGTSPKLHLDDQWLSYFDRVQKEIILYNLQTQTQKKVKILNNINHYFTPEVMMITPNDVLYTDINNQGYYALLLYSFVENKFKTIYKVNYPGQKLEYCAIGDQLYIGEFPFSEVNVTSNIFSMKLIGVNGLKRTTPLYSSDQADIGNLTCFKDKLYFIKTINMNTKLNTKYTEIAQIDLKDNSTKILTKFKYVNQIIPMGGVLLTSFQGKYFLLEGKNDLSTDIIKKENK